MHDQRIDNFIANIAFEDISNLENNEIKVILKELEFPTIALALKGTTNDFQEKIFSNLSKRDESMVKEDMEFFDSVKKQDIDNAQKEILQKLYILIKNGNINMKK